MFPFYVTHRKMIPLEDNYEDIIRKAQRGLRLTEAKIESATGVSPEDFSAAKEGVYDEAICRKLAPALNLNADALVAAGSKRWHPHLAAPTEGFAMTTTELGDMTVNAYLVWDTQTRQAALFDTGASAKGLLDVVDREGLKVEYIFLTHTHRDHIADLDAARQATGAQVYVSSREEIDRALIFEWGKTFELGSLSIETLQTTGHAVGGTTYWVRGREPELAVVGDALFAGSMGGGMVSYKDAIDTNSANLFTLRDSTVVCPGHGPLTSIGLEKVHNPFFA